MEKFLSSPAGWMVSIILLVITTGIFIWLLRLTTGKVVILSIPENVRNCVWYQFTFDFNGWAEWLMRTCYMLGAIVLISFGWLVITNPGKLLGLFA